MSIPGRDPLSDLRRSQRREWRAIERRARRQHDDEQLAALAVLAANGVGVTGVDTPPAATDLPLGGSAVDMIIDGRRLRAGRIHRRSLAALRDALSSLATVPLTTVGRYGPYWVLTFKLATEQLVVLADQLTLMPDWGGSGGRGLLPTGPLATLGA